MTFSKQPQGFPSPRIPTVRVERVELQDHMNSDSCYKIILGWINNCLSNHTDCHQKDQVLPTRVINIRGKNPVLQDGNGINSRYVALSHRWVSKPTITTTEASIKDWQLKIPMSELPRTFQDAITVSKKLGVEYLWIDSMCIIQDSTEDWLVESQKMLEYYRNAYLKISALDSPDSHHGFLDNREEVPFVKLSTYENLFLRPRLPEQHEFLQNALLSRRAWVLQERLLSTRVLHYSNRELFWECLTCSARESSLVERGGHVDPSSVVLSEGDDFKRVLSTLSKYSQDSAKSVAMIIWYRLVTQYSRKAMTRSSEKLPAISGIASAIHAATGYSYLAGIWKEKGLKGLLWFSDESQDHPKEYIAPRWSWASHGAVSMRYGFKKPITSSQDAEIVDSRSETTGKSRFCQVSCAQITIRAFTTNLCYQHSRYNYRLDDKPWSLTGFQTREGQDLDLFMTASLGFGKGFVDIIDNELITANERIEILSRKAPEIVLRPKFSDPRHNLDFKYRPYHDSLISMKQCVAIWIARRVGEADSYMGGCKNDRKGQAYLVREILYCLLVVEDRNEKCKWRRIGIARAPVDYIKQCEWSEKRDMVLI